MTAHLANDQTLLLNLDEVAHHLPVVRFGRSVRIERTAVEELVSTHRQEAG